MNLFLFLVCCKFRGEVVSSDDFDHVNPSIHQSEVENIKVILFSLDKVGWVVSPPFLVYALFKNVPICLGKKINIKEHQWMILFVQFQFEFPNEQKGTC